VILGEGNHFFGKSVGVGVIGLGAISRFYFAALQRRDDVSLRAVADIDASKLAPFEAQGVPVTLGVDALLEQEGVDAVVVNVPNDQHAAICAQLIEAGKHVCCEKPLTLDPEEAARLTSSAEDVGVVLLTAFHRRYNRHVRALMKRIDGSPVRRLHAYYDEKIEDHCGPDAWYLDPQACGGGCIVDNGSNLLDLAACLLGEFKLRKISVDWRDGLDIRSRILGISDDGANIILDLDWAYGQGERKKLIVELDDGTLLNADMLADFPRFKESLWHEYDGVVEDFIARIGRNESTSGMLPPSGERVAWQIADAYRLAGQTTARGGQ